MNKLRTKIEYFKNDVKNNLIILFFWLLTFAVSTAFPLYMFCNVVGIFSKTPGIKILFGGMIFLIVVILSLWKTFNELINRLSSGVLRAILQTVKTVALLSMLLFILTNIDCTIGELLPVVTNAIILNAVAVIPRAFMQEFCRRKTADERMYDEELAEMRREERRVEREKKRQERVKNEDEEVILQ